MELVEGETIDSLVRSAGPLEPAEAVRIARQVAGALAYAHSRDVIHRDVTPRNILVDPAAGRVRVVDFGIAQDTGGTIHETYVTQDSSLGTVAFMSPEQNLSGQVDRRSDVFSLGMTLHFMLTGRPAYVARNRAELALAFRMRSPSPPSEYNSAVPRALDEVVGRMIAVDPDDRYADCAEASSALGRALSGQASGRHSQPRRRWMTPTRALAAMATVAAVVAMHAWLGSWRAEATGPTARPRLPRAAAQETPPPPEPERFALFGPIPSPPRPTALAGETDPDAFAAAVVDSIEVPLPPPGWEPPDVPEDGSETWLAEFAPSPPSTGPAAEAD
jgi:serine/threonine-protein kinase